LLLENLCAAHWPPPWTPARVETVLATLAAVHAALPKVADLNLASCEAERPSLASWARIAADPDAFLSLGFCDAGWLTAALPTLIAADVAAVLDGNGLLHQDVRSDNLCFSNGRAILVDWNWCARGNDLVDVAGWLPSLHAEGGPAPETILPHAGALAALLAGYFAWRAGQPDPFPGARVRQVQRQQLAVALPWAARALDLPPPAAGPRAI